MQLLRELQQHKLSPLVEASLQQKSQREGRTNGLPNGSPDGVSPRQGSSEEHDAKRLTVYLLLAPKTAWESVRSQVRWPLNDAWKLKDVHDAQMHVHAHVGRAQHALHVRGALTRFLRRRGILAGVTYMHGKGRSRFVKGHEVGGLCRSYV